ncbi:hypothetical protein [Pantoea ananatis]|nr:hypothetical protein [Pantoea ananatis]
MSRSYDFAEVSKLLNELEECANRIHKISSDFVKEMQAETAKQAA